MQQSKRHKIEQHFTASGLVLAEGHILLVHHRRIDAWLPPGGHIEPFEMPHEAAIREVLEETGVAVEVVSEPVPLTGDADAFFLKSPLCLHTVRAQENGQDVYHIDIAYLCRPQQPSLTAAALPVVKHSQEVKAAAWVSLECLKSLRLARNVCEAVELALAKLAAPIRVR